MKISKVLFGFILGIICAGTCVYAANSLLAKDVLYEPSNSSFNVSNVSAALDYLYTAKDCVKGTYHHEANTQWNIELGFTPSLFFVVYKSSVSHANIVYDSKYDKKVYLSTFESGKVSDWSSYFETITANIKTKFITEFRTYNEEYDLEYYACK